MIKCHVCKRELARLPGGIRSSFIFAYDPSFLHVTRRYSTISKATRRKYGRLAWGSLLPACPDCIVSVLPAWLLDTKPGVRFGSELSNVKLRRSQITLVEASHAGKSVQVEL